MKKTSLTILLACITMLAFAQNPLRPSELITEGKAIGEKFETISLFQLNLEKSDQVLELDKAVSEYDVLTLDLNQVQQLLATKPQSLSLTLPAEAKSATTLELIKVDLLTDDFILTADGIPAAVEVEGVHYRGIVKGDERSIVAISVFPEEVMGLVSSDAIGNLSLGRLQGEAFTAADHIIYNDKDLLLDLGMHSSCDTPDDGVGYTREELSPQPNGRALSDCVRLFYEVDKDIHDGKGGVTGATNYVTGLGNQVATLYANESINTEISQINVITSSANQYSDGSSSQMLSQFQGRYSGFNGDLGQMLSYKSSGGIAAGFAGICASNPDNSMSFSSIASSYSTVPTYSWSVMVVTHEFGHTFGSRHTHACVWNGNNTAIDGCAGATEGTCSLPGYPSGGGTIMSYCHLQSVGINFNNGFGSQPGNVIRNSVSNGSCLQACGGGGGGGCDDNELTLTINLDNYPGETTWEVRNDGGSVVASGGSYSGAGTTVVEDICLVDGCDYTFTIFDSYGDGICCGYGNGSYTLSGPGGTIASGGAFGSSESTDFDLGSGCGGGGGTCTEIDFNSYTINSYGGSQDNGSGSVYGSGEGIVLTGNSWKSISLNYTITSNTVIEFEFGSTSQGEIHGIGFDTDNSISANRTFQLYGTQNWGNRDYDYTNPGYWQSFTVPVGSYYTGTFNRLFFSNDKDSGSTNNNTYFRNIKIYEGSACGTSLPAGSVTAAIEGGGTGLTAYSDGFEVYPNPTTDELNVRFSLQAGEAATIRMFNLTGQLIEMRQVTTEGQQTEQFSTSDLPQGTYLIRVETDQNRYVKKFHVAR